MCDRGFYGVHSRGSLAALTGLPGSEEMVVVDWVEEVVGAATFCLLGGVISSLHLHLLISSLHHHLNISLQLPNLRGVWQLPSLGSRQNLHSCRGLLEITSRSSKRITKKTNKTINFSQPA